MINRLTVGVMLAFSLFAGVTFSSPAYALEYGVLQTPTLSWGNGDGCPAGADISTSWSQFMSTDTAVEYSYKNSWSYDYNADDTQGKMDSFASEYQSHLSSGSGWAVLQLNNAAGTTGYGLRIVLFEPNATLTLHDGYLQVSTGNFKFADFIQNTNAGCRLQNYNYNQSSAYSPYLNWIDNYASGIFLIASDNIIYPEDYTGDPFQGQTVLKTKVNPDFTYTVTDKSIHAVDRNQELPTVTPTEGYTISGYSVEWTLNQCTTFTDVGNICNDPTQKDYRILTQSGTYTFTVQDYGHYQLESNYLVQQCYRYPSYPSTPDYCFYVDLGTELPTYDFTATTIHLKVDGSTITGSTNEGDCDVSGYCEPPSPYEDCSIYGVDIAGAIGCHFRNFGQYLKSILIALFVPRASFMNAFVNQMQSTVVDKLGFIMYPFHFIYGLLNGLLSATDSCVVSATSIPGADLANTFFGAHPNLDVCSSEHDFPELYNITTFFIRMLTVLSLIYALFRKLGAFLGRNSNDSKGVHV